MLSKSKTRSIVTTNKIASIYAFHSSEEMFYFDGTNADAIVHWGNGDIRVENGNLIIFRGVDRIVEKNSYVVHSHGVSISGNCFYNFDFIPGRIAVHRYNQKTLRNRGETLVGRVTFIRKHFPNRHY